MKKEISNYEMISYILGFEAGKVLGNIMDKLPKEEKEKIQDRLFAKLTEIINNTDMSTRKKLIEATKPFEFQDEVLDIYKSFSKVDWWRIPRLNDKLFNKVDNK